MQEDTQTSGWRQVNQQEYKGISNKIGIKFILTIIIILSICVCFIALQSYTYQSQTIKAQKQIIVNSPIKQHTQQSDNNKTQPIINSNENVTKQQNSTNSTLTKGKSQKESKTNSTIQNKTLNNFGSNLTKVQINATSKGQVNSSTQTYREVNNILSFAPIHAGEIHFSRVPFEYWQHRLLMIKALGFNAVSVYIFWNHHQLEKGVFDFKNGQRNLVAFLQLTMKHNLKVLLRPGPYVCAQWDFGGIPARLLGVQGLTVRAANALYQEEVFIYFKALTQIIKPFLQINKGNIILIQIQNEFGSFGTDRKHTLNLLQMWKLLRVQCNFYYQDAYWNWSKHFWQGASIGLSEGQHIQQYSDLQKTLKFKDRLIFGGEVYTGWLTHWGQNWKGLDANQFKNHLNGLLSNNRSFSLYVIHGGSNFGLSAGANDFHNQKFMPDITSYDYDAPINEQGRSTQKYQFIKELMTKIGKVQPTPQPIKTISIPKIALSLHANLFLNLPQQNSISKITFFENNQIKMYHQGIVIYETILPKPAQYRLNLIVHDFALIYVDEKFQGSIMREKFKDIKKITVKCQKEQCKLKIVIQAMGHVNYGPIQIQDRKGLLHFQVEGQNTPFNWKIYKINLNDSTVLDWKNKDKQMKGVTLLKGKFDLKQKGDTFFDLQPFVKGYIWVNNHLLGRYWNIGPQQRIFCPGVWLKEQNNQIFILQLLQVKSFEIKSVQTLR